MFCSKSIKILALCSSILFDFSSHAEVSRIEILQREQISSENVDYSYEKIQGVIYFTLDPTDSANAGVTDIKHAQINEEGKVTYSADFKLLVPTSDIANETLLYMVNNRGRGTTPPETSLDHPLSEKGYTYLVTGWIHELEQSLAILRLHAPPVGNEARPIKGDVRYEISVYSATNDVNITMSDGHLAYEPSRFGYDNVSLTQRLYQTDPRIPIDDSQFSLKVNDSPNSDLKEISLNIRGGFKPGYIYELIYEAKNPGLAGAGMTGIRDIVSLIRYGGEAQTEVGELKLPEIKYTIAYGHSQSGRLLRQFVYDGFNEDVHGRRVFDGVIPYGAGGGRGMFNNRFAMPTRTNGHHSNHLFPLDLFPFTYGPATDPFTGVTEGILSRAVSTGTVPYIMHIQTSNEYWLRGGSLPHTDPTGTVDAVIPEEVRFYTIGGSPHSSSNGLPRRTKTFQLTSNPNMWDPILFSLISKMDDWIVDDLDPPPSKYPKIGNNSLVVSHLSGDINLSAWRPLSFIIHPASSYTPSYNYYGDRWSDESIIDSHPTSARGDYKAMVPSVDSNNNDLSLSTILPPTVEVPLATYTGWNLRTTEMGAENSLARLTGGYIPFARDDASAAANNDRRISIASLYSTFEEYLQKYEAATDSLIRDGYLLPGFKPVYMDIARAMEDTFE